MQVEQFSYVCAVETKIKTNDNLETSHICNKTI